MSNVAPPRGRAFEDGPERAVGARRDGSSRFWILAAVGLLLLALVVRVAYVLHSSNYFPRIDAASYNLLASGLAQGHGWVLGSSAYRPPGYPFFLAGVYLLFGVPHTSWTDPRLVQAVVLSTVTVGLTGLMAWQVAGRAAALISMAIAALYIPLVLVGVSLMTESLFVPLVLGATNCALYSRRAEHSRRWVVAAGFLTGLAALTRGNGLVVGLALALVVWGAKPRLSWRAVASPALLLVVMCLTIMPWTVRNAIAQHAFIPVTTELGTTLSGEYNNLSAKHHFIWEIGGYSTYHAIKHDKSIREATRNDRLTSAVIKYLGQHPTYLPQAVFWNTLRAVGSPGIVRLAPDRAHRHRRHRRLRRPRRLQLLVSRRARDRRPVHARRPARAALAVGGAVPDLAQRGRDHHRHPALRGPSRPVRDHARRVRGRGGGEGDSARPRAVACVGGDAGAGITARGRLGPGGRALTSAPPRPRCWPAAPACGGASNRIVAIPKRKPPTWAK